MPKIQLRTLGDVAAELCLPRWKLAYHIERGTVPDASQFVRGRRLFTPEDIERIRQALASRTARTVTSNKPKPPAGGSA